MTDLRKAAEMALEALEYESKRGNDNAYAKEREALRQALAQPEQEPEVLVKQEFKLYDDGRIDPIHVLIRARDAILAMRTDSCPSVKGTILMADTNESLLDVLNRAIEAKR